jgi:hypothetical protein
LHVAQRFELFLDAYRRRGRQSGHARRRYEKKRTRHSCRVRSGVSPVYWRRPLIEHPHEKTPLRKRE